MLKSVKDRYIRHLPSKNMSFTNMQYTAKPPRIRPITQTNKKNTHLIYKDFANITNNNKSVEKSRKSRDLQSHKRKKKKNKMVLGHVHLCTPLCGHVPLPWWQYYE